MNKIILRREINIDPVYMDENLEKNLLRIIKENTRNDCAEKDGYIIDVHEPCKIISNNISSATSDFIVLLEFSATTLKPKIGELHEGRVCMIFESGILIEIQNRLKTLIPLKEEWVLGFEKVTTEEGKCIELQDRVKVIITGVQYNIINRNFSSFGKLVN